MGTKAEAQDENGSVVAAICARKSVLGVDMCTCCCSICCLLVAAAVLVDMVASCWCGGCLTVEIVADGCCADVIVTG